MGKEKKLPRGAGAFGCDEILLSLLVSNRGKRGELHRADGGIHARCDRDDDRKPDRAEHEIGGDDAA